MEKALKTKILRYVASIIVFVLLASYLCYHIFFSSTQNIITEIAKPITEEVTLSADGYIMRNETVLNSNIEHASVAYFFDDGTKIAKNSTVASLYSGENTENGNALINIDKQIDFLEKSNVDTIYKTSDTKTVDSKLSELFYGIRYSIEGGSITNVIDQSEDMLMFMNRRMIITGELSSFSPKIESLKSEREKYQASLGNSSSSVVSSISGYFYADCDGYEDYFSADIARSMSYDEFVSLTKLSPKDTSMTVGKMAYDYTWYLVCPTDKTELKDFAAGELYDIIFEANSNTKLSMKLARIVSDKKSDGSLLVFSSNNCPEGFHFSRMQPVKVVKSSVSGIKVPVGALRVIDGQTGVFILYGSRVRFRGFEILAQNENYYIASIPDPIEDNPNYTPLKVYDNLVVSGKELYDGKVVS